MTRKARIAGESLWQGVLLNEMITNQPFVIICKSRPPTGCAAWRVTRDTTTVTVAAVTRDGDTVVEGSGDYHDPKTGMWRDPREVAERLAQAILWGKALEALSANKTKR